MGTSVPQAPSPGSATYVDTGRSAQKRRTRDALVTAARQELAHGRPVTVESAATAAGISRTTAYRYFANHRDLIAAAHPQIDLESLLPTPAPADPAERLSLVMRAFIHDVTLAWEPQLRAALHLALAPPPEPGTADAGTLRQGRGIRWILQALQPLADTRLGLDLELLARAIRSAAGIEALIWLTDVGGLPREQAATVMHASAMAILRDATQRDTWP
ncbi:TetR/AcrR family transcriptional regulator [Actinoplanes sp. NPDC051633]|uniref:TetR/AcrR family transcriptional regulator n=1 Tax=Actinoplanes sp. NPDC051633 TaxID=3155670 RepID=UPI0034284147